MRTEPKSAMPTPPVPPSSQQSDHIERTLEMIRPSAGQHSTQEPTLGIDFSAANQRGIVIDNGGSTFPIQSLHGVPLPPPGADLISGRDFVSPKKQEETKQTAATPPPVQAVSSEQARPISRMEMEQIIREEVRRAIEKIARESLPQIAESVIRQEIEKILAEP